MQIVRNVCKSFRIISVLEILLAQHWNPLNLSCPVGFTNLSHLLTKCRKKSLYLRDSACVAGLQHFPFVTA